MGQGCGKEAMLRSLEGGLVSVSHLMLLRYVKMDGMVCRVHKSVRASLLKGIIALFGVM